MAGKPISQDEPSKKGKPPNRRPILVRILGALKRYENRRHRRSQKEKSDRDLITARWTRRVGIFTAALVVVGSVTGGIFWQQLSVMQGQLGEMQAARRPWLTVHVKIAGPLIVLPRPHIDIDFTITNIGQSPAMEAWVNASLFPFLKDSDPVKEMPQRCANLRVDMLRREAKPREPGYTLFPAHHIEMRRTVEISTDEYNKWQQSGRTEFIMIMLLVCGDYRFSFAPDAIHSTNLLYTLATTVMNTSDKLRIMALPEKWNLVINPDVGRLGPDILRLYQEPFGDTYAN